MDDYNDCLKRYSYSMQELLQAGRYVEENEFDEHHGRNKQEMIAEFERKSNLISPKIVSFLTRRMNDIIDENFLHFKRENEMQRKNLDVSIVYEERNICLSVRGFYIVRALNMSSAKENFHVVVLQFQYLHYSILTKSNIVSN